MQPATAATTTTWKITFTIDTAEVRQRIVAARRDLAPGQRAIRGLYAGGTLAHEAVLILSSLVSAVASNLHPGSEEIHHVLDLGADEFTVGRAFGVISTWRGL